jgi:hypothetical protein
MIWFRAVNRDTNEPVTGWLFKLTEVFDIVRTRFPSEFEQEKFFIERMEAQEVL